MMRVAIIIAVAIALVASGIVPSNGVVYGQAKRGQPTYGVYFPSISVPPNAGISLVRILVTCGHVAAVTQIPDDWYVRTLRPDTESEPEWNEFRSAWNAVELEAGHGVTRLRNLKSLDGAIKVAIEDTRCFDIVADIKDDMTDDGWKTRLRKPQLQLRN